MLELLRLRETVMSTIEREITKTKNRVKDSEKKASSTGGGLKFSRLMTRVGIHPYDEVQWEKRSASITNDKGEKILDVEDVEIPEFWSQLATNVVVSKYFRSQSKSGERETSARQIIDRVVDTVCSWGRRDGYFASAHDAETFEHELTFVLLHQMATFNSPVWFNVGIEEQPQASACFINSVEDTMESIMGLATTEANLFKGGSGSGTNLSTIRSSREKLSMGGQASGPVSFMRGFDAFAGVIKSGGKTRRAAKMVILNVDHPDIVEFARARCDAPDRFPQLGLAVAISDGLLRAARERESGAEVGWVPAERGLQVPDRSSGIAGGEHRGPEVVVDQRGAGPVIAQARE